MRKQEDNAINMNEDLTVNEQEQDKPKHEPQIGLKFEAKQSIDDHPELIHLTLELNNFPRKDLSSFLSSISDLFVSK